MHGALQDQPDGGERLRVREINEFQSLENDWRSLLEKSMDDDVFSTWEWQSTWWRHFGNGRKLRILLVEDKDRVLAVAPLMLSRYSVPGLGEIRKIEFVGAPHSDYHHFIILKNELEYVKLAIDYLEHNFADWDWIELKEVPASSLTANLLRTYACNISSELGIRERVCNICPYISLPDSLDLLMKGLTRNIRQNLKKYSRRIEAKYDLKLETYDEAGFSVEEAMEAFIKLHQKRWTAKGLPGAFRVQRKKFHDFHIEVAKRFAEKGWLGLFFLTANDEIASAQLTFEYKGKMYAYLSGLNPEYVNYSAGNLIIMLLLERCLRKSIKEYDMMRGDESYKALWTPRYRRNFETWFIRRNLRSRFYGWATWNNTITNLAKKLRISLEPKYT